MNPLRAPVYRFGEKTVHVSVDRVRRSREFWLGGADLSYEEHRTKPGNFPLLKVKRIEGHFEALLPRIRGFVSDLLGFEGGAPAMGGQIALSDWEGTSAVRWPRLVPDEAWDQILAIEPPPARPSGLSRSGDIPMRDFGERGRGASDLDRLLEAVPVTRLLLQTTTDPDSPTRIWWSDGTGDAVTGAHTEHGTWRELWEAFAKRALLLRASDFSSWERENVVRGEFLHPTPDEVEVYRALGEELPLLWPTDRLVEWLEEQS